MPTLSDQILKEMNIEAEWAKLQKSRDLEKIEKKLKEERENAYVIRDEYQVKELVNENKEEQEKASGLDTSVESLSNSILSDDNKLALPDGILDKKQKQLIWEEIKTKSNNQF